MATKREPQKFNFTKPKLSALEPPANGREYVYDARTPGLTICITEKGTKTFYFYRRIDGRPVRLKIGRFPEISIEKARTNATKFAGQIADGKNPQQERKAARKDMTFGELFDHFMENHSKIHKKTWQEDQRQFDRYLKPFASRKLSAITSDDFAALHRRMGEKNGPYAANRMLALVSSMYSNGPESIRSHLNPAKGIKRFKEKSRERFLQPDELPRFFEALNAEANESLRDFLWLAILTGVRRSDVLAMRWDHLHLNLAEWWIPETKNDDPVKVHLVPEAVAILDRRECESDGSEWVFPGRGRTGHLVEPKLAWDRVRARAGLSDVRLHDLRRTLGSYQAATGSSLPIIGKSLGHRSQATTAIYARLNLDPVRESVDRATEAILRAGNVRIEREDNE